MAVGALLMSASTVVVAANAQLLRRLDLRPGISVAALLRGSDSDGRTQATPTSTVLPGGHR
jgi:Cu2+-exporting ATPase